MNFGENLRTLRRKKNISQEELAGKLNVSRQAVSRWEQGVSQTKVFTCLQTKEYCY